MTNIANEPSTANRNMMRSVQRILAVFESFSSDRTSLTLQEVAERIELPKSTAFRIVQSLEKAGYLIRLEDQEYCLSFRFTRLAGMVRSTLDVRAIARPILVELAQQTKETVSLHTLSGRSRVCIDALSTVSAPLRAVTQPGEETPLLGGSGSKVLLAHMQPLELTSILPSVARVLNVTDEALIAELELIRALGYAVSHGERLLGISAASAPIRDANQEVRYCLSVAAPTVRLRVNEDEAIRLVVSAAEKISRRFGALYQ